MITDRRQANTTKGSEQQVQSKSIVNEVKDVEVSQNARSETVDIPDQDFELLAQLVSHEFARVAVELSKNNSQEEASCKSAVSDPIQDRKKRGQIHQEIRRIFKSKLETSTNDDGAIIASLVTNNRSNNKKRREKPRGPREGPPAGEYLHFTLYKDNRDTVDAVNQITRILRIKPTSVGYAGTKDRRASTAQRCSVRYQRKAALDGLNGKLWGISTGDYTFANGPIHLGQLNGNEFVIILKNCAQSKVGQEMGLSQTVESLQKEAHATLSSMGTQGWINYFGHQRFGTHEIGTHRIGQLLLAEKFEDAVNSLMSYDADLAEKAEAGELGENPARRDEFARHQACMLFQTNKDVQRALQIMPRRFSAECSIMKHLARLGSKTRRDFVGAIMFITRGLRSMYFHAYQSIVWNHAASKRWELFGATVTKGDLILAEAEIKRQPQEKDQDGDEIINPIEEDADSPLIAREITDEELSSGRFTIHDIVLPSPGYDIVYPGGEIGQFYKDFMGKEENGNLDPHSMRRKQREFSLPGHYRKLMNKFLAKPSIEFKTYSDDEEQMHPTDMDKIKAASSDNSVKRPRANSYAPGEAVPKRVKSGNINDKDDALHADALQDDPSNQTTTDNREVNTESTSIQTKIAAIVKFQLGKSAYATVVLRELMGDQP